MSRPSPEQQIIQAAAQGHSRHFICETLHVGEHRVSRVLRDFQATGIIPAPLHPGRPPKVTQVILDFINIRTLQSASLSGTQLANEIRNRYHISLSRATIDFQSKLIGFHYQPARHIQELRTYQVIARIEFCQRMLANPGWLPLIHFSDESRFVLGDDKRWIWYRRGEENDSAAHSTQKFPPSLMVFAVIGIGYRSKLLFVDGTIDADRYIYIQNLTELGIIEEFARSQSN
jgi:transposase